MRKLFHAILETIYRPNRQRKLFESGQAKDTLKQVSLNSGLETNGVSSTLCSHHFFKLIFIGQNIIII